MVFAHHLVWTAYGWWLPNDPRGSMSRWIASDLIAELGELHHGRKRFQPASRELREFYEQAAAALKFPLLRLAPAEADAVFLAFAHVIAACGYTCYACAILPDHVHLCVRKHRDRAEDMIQNLQAESRRRAVTRGFGRRITRCGAGRGGRSSSTRSRTSRGPCGTSRTTR